jgi:hypothetical protein
VDGDSPGPETVLLIGDIIERATVTTVRVFRSRLRFVHILACHGLMLPTTGPMSRRTYLCRSISRWICFSLIGCRM